MDATTDSILLKPDIVHPSQPSILMPQETQPIINYSPKKNLIINRKLSLTLKTFAAGRKRKQSPFTNKNTQQPHITIPHKGTKQPESGHQPSKIRWHHMGEGRRKQKSRTLPAMMIQQSLVTLCLATSSNSSTLSLAIAEPYALSQNSHPKELALCSHGIEAWSVEAEAVGLL